MTLDATGRSFIIAREGFKSNAYLDIKGVPTIGYGTTVYPNGRPVKLGDTCTTEIAESYFAHDLETFEKCVNKAIDVKEKVNNSVLGIETIYEALTQNQFNALVCLCYNIGITAFPKSRLASRVNSIARNDRDSISQAFLMWNKISVIKNGIKEMQVSPGLVNRRAKEIELYFS